MRRIKCNFCGRKFRGNRGIGIHNIHCRENRINDAMAKAQGEVVEQKSPILQGYEGGATRTIMLDRFDLIPPEAIHSMARRWGLGADKHGEGNWKHGGVKFIKATINHMQKHIQFELLSYKLPTGDDDLGAILWGAGALKWFQVNKKDEYEQALKELGEGLVENKSKG